MKQRQQNTNIGTLVKFNQDIISLIKNAKKIGLNLDQTLKMVKEVWIQTELPTELPDEIDFRIKAKKFVENHHEEITEKEKYFCKKYVSYKRIGYSVKREFREKFLIECLVSFYKVFKNKSFDKKEMKRISVERTKTLFPDMSTGHKGGFDAAYQTLVRYAYEYKSDELSVFASQYEPKTLEEKGLVRLIGMVVLEI